MHQYAANCHADGVLVLDAHGGFCHVLYVRTGASQNVETTGVPPLGRARLIKHICQLYVDYLLAGAHPIGSR